MKTDQNGSKPGIDREAGRIAGFDSGSCRVFVGSFAVRFGFARVRFRSFSGMLLFIFNGLAAALGLKEALLRE